MDPSKVDEYVSEPRSYQNGHSPFVRIGLEIDWFTNHRSIVYPFIEEIELDQRIGSLHHVDEAPFDDCFSLEISKIACLREPKISFKPIEAALEKAD